MSDSVLMKLLASREKSLGALDKAIAGLLEQQASAGGSALWVMLDNEVKVRRLRRARIQLEVEALRQQLEQQNAAHKAANPELPLGNATPRGKK